VSRPAAEGGGIDRDRLRRGEWGGGGGPGCMPELGNGAFVSYPAVRGGGVQCSDRHGQG
jgi:hypothetical protein